MRWDQAKCKEGHRGRKGTGGHELYMLTHALDGRFIVRSDGNKVAASADPSCL